MFLKPRILENSRLFYGPLDIFRPTQIRLPAPVIAKLFIEDIEKKYPKLYACLKAGQVEVLSLAMDGEPRNGNFSYCCNF